MNTGVDDQTFWDAIEGYCGRLSFAPGETAAVHISCQTGQFDLVVERWAGQRVEVWETKGVAGQYHPAPPNADSEGCGWPVSVEIPIGQDWESGFYLVTLTALGAQRGRDTAHCCFVVRARAEDRQSVLLVLATNTWNAYNTWGGRSLYTGGHQVSFRRPFGRGMLCRASVERDDRKARPVRRGERPDIDGEIFQNYRTAHGYPSAIGSAGWFTHERRFVEWAYRNGFSFDMAVSADLETVPDLADGYDLVLSVGHDEYWSATARDAIDTHIGGGANFASFSGNTMFWQVRLVDGADGDAAAHMVCHKYRAHLDDPVVEGPDRAQMTGMWADPIVGRPEWSTLGAGSAFGLYHRFGQATPTGMGGFSIVNPDHWVIAGTGLTYGDVVGSDDGVVGYETLGCPVQFDDCQRLVARPHAHQASDIDIIGFAFSSNLGIGQYPKSIAALNDQGDLEFIADRIYGEVNDQNLARVRRGNAVIVACRPFGSTGGEVVTVGTTDWVFGLASDVQVQTITANVVGGLGSASGRPS